MTSTEPFVGTLIGAGWEETQALGEDRAFVVRIRLDGPVPWPMQAVWQAWPVNVSRAEASSPTPDGVIKERGEDERTWDEGITYGLAQLCAMLNVDPSKVRWDAATETVEGDVRSVIGNILSAWAGDDWQDLPAIREMLLEGQGDDDGSRILPDFQEGMTIHAMVAACVHLLERRRDALDGYAAANAEAPASTVQPPSSQESGVGETEGWEFASSLSNRDAGIWEVTLRRTADRRLVTGKSEAGLEAAYAAARELARRAPVLALAEGCCSAVSPCSHQRHSPYTICDICQQAHDHSAPRPSQREG